MEKRPGAGLFHFGDVYLAANTLGMVSNCVVGSLAPEDLIT